MCPVLQEVESVTSPCLVNERLVSEGKLGKPWAKPVKRKLFAPLLTRFLFTLPPKRHFWKLSNGCAGGEPSVTELRSVCLLALAWSLIKLSYIADRTLFPPPEDAIFYLPLSCLLYPPDIFHLLFPMPAEILSSWICWIVVIFIHCRPASILVTTWSQLPKRSLNLAHVSGRHLCQHTYFHKQSLHCFRFKLRVGLLEWIPNKTLREEKKCKQLELILNRTTSGKHLTLQKRMGMLILPSLPSSFEMGMKVSLIELF